MATQRITVTLDAPADVDAERLVAGLAEAGRDFEVIVQEEKFASASNITFVSTEVVEDSTEG